MTRKADSKVIEEGFFLRNVNEDNGEWGKMEVYSSGK